MSKSQQPERPHIDAKVSHLQTLLLTANDLAEVSDYFHDVLVSDDAFISTGTLSSNPRLIAALQAALERVVPEGKLGTPFMIRLQHQALCHGYSTWGSGHVVFFYFEQLDLGFCSYTPSLCSPQVIFVRFNLTDLTGAGAWSAWPSASTATRGVLQ